MKKGFTLAEVLVTIAIVGVVAALTIPLVMANYQKEQTLSRLKKAYNTLSTVFQQSKFYDGVISGQEALDMEKTEYYNKYWRPYLKDAEYCGTYQKCGYKKGQPWLRPNGEETGVNVIHSKGVTFITPDNILYLIRTGSTDSKTGVISSTTLIFVDLNAGKGPNIFGKDVFVFKRAENEGAIKPFCYDKTEEEIEKQSNYPCTMNGVGYCCSQKIISAGWKIPDDYPW